MSSSSTYEISKSSLLSLKAEILRKQEEINKAKLLNVKIVQSQSKPKKVEKRNKGVEERESNDTVEDLDALRKSREVLEAKAKLYDKLMGSKSNLTEDELEYRQRLLVRFDRKETPGKNSDDECDVDKYPEDDDCILKEYPAPSNPDEEWVDYVDCFGRTRTCLRKDLKYLKEKDNELTSGLDQDGMRKIEENNEQIKQIKVNTFGKINLPNLSEENEMLSADMRRELLRQKWEQQEEELKNKTNIHYQDVLFNEARTHGVGYYAFSQDEDMRAKQQAELKKLREETMRQQQAAEEAKSQREKQLADRLKAARNRKRARMGLPPEEDSEEPPEKKEGAEEADAPPAPDPKQAEEEKRKELERKKHIRPWDIGKEGLKKHYEHSQEEWVAKKRTERPEEFAPPTAYSKRDFHANPDTRSYNFDEAEKTLKFSTKKEAKLATFHVDTSVPPPNYIPHIANPAFVPTPIQNEVENYDGQPLEEESYEEVRSQGAARGVEIPPPPTFDYYGPTSTTSFRNAPTRGTTNRTSLEDSIEAGLKFLRSQQERKEAAAERRQYF